MCAIFDIEIVVGVMLVVGLLRLTMSTEPTGCVVIFGSLIGLFFLALPLIPRLLAG